MHAHSPLAVCAFTRYTHTRTRVRRLGRGGGGRGGRPAWLYMWAKNDTLAKVTSCEVSPVCRRLHWLAVSQLLRCGNDVAGWMAGWLAGWRQSHRAYYRRFRASLCEPRAIGSGSLAMLPGIDHRERERERDGFRERHVRWNRSGYIGSPVMRIRLDVSSKVEFFSVDLWAAFFFFFFCTCAR